MIVYEALKKQFDLDVDMNMISDIIYSKLREKGLSGGSESEYNSWQNSLHYMRTALNDPEIPEDSEISIEYQIPRTSLRVDFIISGANEERDNVVIVELKQWQKAEKVDDVMQHSVRTYTGHKDRIVEHPSYKAFSYARHIKNYAEVVEEKNIGIIPCAYLHNYSPEFVDQLKDDIYKDWYEEAPFFIKNQMLELRSFIKKFITKKSSDGKLLYTIEHGRIRPSKALQDCLVSLMKGNQEFILLDDQAVAFDMCKKVMQQCQKDLQKRVVIIEGGPGTGKSVLASIY